MWNRLLREHTDIKGILVSLNRPPLRLFRGKGSHPGSTVGTRNKAIEARRKAGIALRAIHLEIAGGLLNLVLHRVSRHDFDITRNSLGCFIPHRYSMPGMRLEHHLHYFE